MPGQQIRWPDHWYHDQNRIRCIVPACGFVASSHLVEQQYKEICDHCLTTIGAEHDLLNIMLNQTLCAINKCTSPSFAHRSKSHAIRSLFKHEKDAHGSAEMSSICFFVRLAREGRVRKGTKLGSAPAEPEPNCERVAYYRMMEKVWALPSTDLLMLFRRNGCHHPDTQTSENLGKILTHDPLAREGENPPFWWPVKAESFLSHCRPNFSNPADSDWIRLWRNLREKYADGRI